METNHDVVIYSVVKRSKLPQPGVMIWIHKLIKKTQLLTAQIGAKQ